MENAAGKCPKDIAAMEQSLKRLEEQEQKYSAELDAALNEYAGLRVQEAYGEKYGPLLMFDSKKAVSWMVHEDMERQVVRRMVRQTQKERQTF